MTLNDLPKFTAARIVHAMSLLEQYVDNGKYLGNDVDERVTEALVVLEAAFPKWREEDPR